MSLPVQITVGGAGLYDPAAGSTECPIATLKGVTIYLEKAGTGTMPYSAYTPLTNGGFRLNSATFQSGDTYFVHQVGVEQQNNTGNYTNGFNYQQVIGALLGRMGWRPSTVANQPVLNGLNTTSRSGRYFNDFHALLTINNIKAILEDKNATDAVMNAELESWQCSSIMRGLTAVFGAPEYLEQVVLFERLGRLDTPIPNEGLFVGYEINVAKSFDKAVQIHGATMLFDSDCSVPLYLFKDGKKTPIWSQTVDVVAGEATAVTFDDLVLNYVSPNTKGGRFYFGYFQDDLGQAQAIREQIDCWNKTLCFCATPMYSKKIVGALDFDRDSHSLPNIPYGMNLEISSFSDWTPKVMQMAPLFDELVGLYMAYVVLERIIYTTRSNGTERKLLEGINLAAAIADLKGSAPVSDGPPPVMGLDKRIAKEVERVRKEMVPKRKNTTYNLVTCS